MELPIFQLTLADDLDSEQEIEFISLVGRPAIERNFLAFNEQKRLAFSDDGRRIITGPAMVPDQAIYRKDDKMGEYLVVFDRANVMRAAQKFLAKGYANRINLDHNRDAQPKGVYVFESFVTDAQRGITAPAAFSDAPEGTWFISAHVNDAETWNRVKAGEFRGFSVEGIFAMGFKPEMQPESILAEIEKILQR